MKYIVIVGCGKTGQSLAVEFSQDCNVVVVDRNKRALEALGDNFNGKKVFGDALDIKVLENAGIKDANVLILVTGNDNLNLVIGKIVKDMYKVEKILLQVYDATKKNIFANSGLQIINKTRLMVEVFRKCIS